ncbi:helix-turn-helix domain-containing protein [Bacillus atrophaeus]|uniref:helix-turn-helix domain-containing protein n=1 Tax=Bacillus atrophaeus TaxID=1452 RepID=UPI0007C57410|nr:helix-turn-helix transcriptional regulator [Bacillus atrophaeus]MCY8857466.1 helix-turn-helix domain-containing protein [Bacillus atrophaeus]MCY8975627.1 helix-turn-helix domain-containing protein [Bacillus atrophaeus]MED1121301.1 helix-turn-helix transcriptional regulator [Bacillus atrophaeus]WFE15323.1 helix-turn-helix transcriptional regulator [Bacillus atrophaeus]
MNFGDRLKKLREKTGWTQTFVAEKIGVKNNTLSSYESAKRQPDYETTKKLADLYKVSTDYILTGNVPSNPGNDFLKDPDLQIAFKDASDFSEEARKQAIDFIKYLKEKEKEKGRTPKGNDNN